jgi:mannosyltransferase
MNDIELLVTNIKKRYTGVSGTINALLPIQSKMRKLKLIGDALPNGIASISYLQAIRISKQALSNGKPFRIWHVRRDPEMIRAIFARDLLKLPIKLVFTSAAKHQHGRFASWLISKMDAVISTTPEAASYLSNTTKIVPHGVDTNRFTPPISKEKEWASANLPGEFGIGTFGRVRDDKGSDIFVHAMLELLPKYPKFTAVILGLCQPQHQSFQRKLQEEIDFAGLSERLLFMGEIPADKVGEWYRRSLITVACPRYEPFGLTVLEGMACGSAVVASRTGAFEEIVIPGLTGDLVPTGDVAALVVALEPLMKNPALALQMGEKGRIRVIEHYSITREAEGIDSVYEGLWNSKTKPVESLAL